MITAYLTIYLMAFGAQAEWPERAVGQFDTTEECWAAIDQLKLDPPIKSAMSVHWRCGENT